MAIKIRSTPSLGLEIKPEAPCRKILRHVKAPFTYVRYWYAKFSLLRIFSYSFPDVSASRITRELWWTSQEFPPADIIITIALHAHISPGGWTIGSLLAAVLRSKSQPFDMITQSIKVWKKILRLYWAT
jgi:hypothetical protein